MTWLHALVFVPALFTIGVFVGAALAIRGAAIRGRRSQPEPDESPDELTFDRETAKRAYLYHLFFRQVTRKE